MKATGVSGCTLVYPDGFTIEEGEERVVRKICAFLDKYNTKRYGEELGYEFVTTITRKPTTVKENEETR